MPEFASRAPSGSTEDSNRKAQTGQWTSKSREHVRKVSEAAAPVAE